MSWRWHKISCSRLHRTVSHCFQTVCRFGCKQKLIHLNVDSTRFFLYKIVAFPYALDALAFDFVSYRNQWLNFTKRGYIVIICHTFQLFNQHMWLNPFKMCLMTDCLLDIIPFFSSYMASSGLDRRLKIWDIRTRRQLHCYKLSAGAGRLAFSQRGMLACTVGNTVEVSPFHTRCSIYLSSFIHT